MGKSRREMLREGPLLVPEFGEPRIRSLVRREGSSAGRTPRPLRRFPAQPMGFPPNLRSVLAPSGIILPLKCNLARGSVHYWVGIG